MENRSLHIMGSQTVNTILTLESNDGSSPEQIVEMLNSHQASVQGNEVIIPPTGCAEGWPVLAKIAHVSSKTVHEPWQRILSPGEDPDRNCWLTSEQRAQLSALRQVLALVGQLSEEGRSQVMKALDLANQPTPGNDQA